MTDDKKPGGGVDDDWSDLLDDFDDLDKLIPVEPKAEDASPAPPSAGGKVPPAPLSDTGYRFIADKRGTTPSTPIAKVPPPPRPRVPPPTGSAPGNPPAPAPPAAPSAPKPASAVTQKLGAQRVQTSAPSKEAARLPHQAAMENAAAVDKAAEEKAAAQEKAAAEKAAAEKAAAEKAAAEKAAAEKAAAEKAAAEKAAAEKAAAEKAAAEKAAAEKAAAEAAALRTAEQAAGEPSGPMTDAEWLDRLTASGVESHERSEDSIDIPSSHAESGSFSFRTGSSASAEVTGTSSARREGLREPVCALWIGGTCFGLPVAIVGEVAPVVSFTDVPLTSSKVIGIFNLRGVALPIIDLPATLGFGTSVNVKKALVLNDGGLRFAVPVDRVEMLAAHRQVVLRDRSPTDHEAVDGFIELDDERVVTLLSSKSVVSAVKGLRDESEA